MLISNCIEICQNDNIHTFSIRFINALTKLAIPKCTIKRVKFDKRNSFDSGKHSKFESSESLDN